MKTATGLKQSNENTAAKKTPAHEEIKTDSPLSEKDEVKQAEKNLRESQKKNG